MGQDGKGDHAGGQLDEHGADRQEPNLAFCLDTAASSQLSEQCIERWALRDPVIKLTVGILFRYKILNDPSPPPLDEPWK
jgi:hypothetical protein